MGLRIRNVLIALPLGVATARADGPDAAVRPWLTLDSAAATQPEDATPVSPPLSPQPATPTGDWGGLRTRLAKNGLTFGGLIQLDTTFNLRGGLDTRTPDFRYLLDLNLTLNTDPLLHWHGGSFFIDFQNHDGRRGGPHTVGDLQGFDTQDAFHFTQIAQLWYQQTFLPAGDLRLKLGKIDANVDFDTPPHARDFFNSSFTFTTSINPLPTYPDPAPGLELFYQPKHFYIGVGGFYSNRLQQFLDFGTHPSQIELPLGGAFLIGEAGLTWTVGRLPGRAGVGVWCHTGKFGRFTGEGLLDGTTGTYAFADQAVFQAQTAGKVTSDLGVFIQLGDSDGAVLPISNNVAAGLAWYGPIQGRTTDVLGAGVTWARLGEIPGLRHNYELAAETFYRLTITPWFSLKPDVQYIVNPGGVYGDALAATLRAEIDF